MYAAIATSFECLPTFVYVEKKYLDVCAENMNRDKFPCSIMDLVIGLDASLTLWQPGL